MVLVPTDYYRPAQRCVTVRSTSDDLMFVYDGDCGFCAAFVDWYRRRPGAEAVACRPWQAVDLAALGLDADMVRSRAWLRGGGRTVGGAPAVAGALATLPGMWHVIGRTLDAGPVRPLAAGVYSMVARHRRRLPGGTGQCATRVASH